MIELRDYQKEAIRSFNEAGIFEMATGTGKTFTALSLSKKYYEEDGRQFLIIIVPFIHLIEQWADQFELFDINSYIGIFDSRKKWVPRLKREIILFNYGMKSRVVIIGSYKSIGSKECQEILNTIGSKQFLIADECHYLGSPLFKTHQMTNFEYKLGLSATPKRWWDEEGTERIMSLFNDVSYEFAMERAINEGFLTQYFYYPEVIKMTEDEEESYQILTKRIGKLMAQKDSGSQEVKDSLDNLILRRSRIIKLAENKKERLKELLLKQTDYRFTLVYCGEGEIELVLGLILSLGIRAQRFDSTISMKDRKNILGMFESGEIEILVAMKCLDEGVDIPATQTAYFLASTTNPREFIQRRGRVLRKSPNKKDAIIYDFIVFPELDDNELVRSVAEKEIPRFAEFSQYAVNEFSARNTILPYLKKYNLESFMDILPWEMYEIIKNRKVDF
ncbi:DEAD/DEAH box helicase family protein [Vagococcus fluvialis]|uniref:DEAD/DEAH box helicase family protein n=1 Tax=Vagococcus fluvialis TaxID=2738 RepID=UPI001D0BABEE|nr:DEAD/DEAH box helicase family protein [Vagococcus fluvialis]UDM80391.1 DEAD/DEAH box helicase family protein [Vagococcus fluvialis]